MAIAYAAVLAVEPHDPVVVIRWTLLVSFLASGAALARWLLRFLPALAESEQLARRQTERVNAELVSASRHKSEVFANMSHELRTPLNAIIGFSDMIVQEAFGPIGEDRYIDYARNVEKAGQQMLGFVIDVLTIAQLEARRFELRRDRLDLAELAETVLAEFRQSDEGQQHELTLSVTGSPPPVFADRRAVEQMLAKLLSNAAKFSPAGTDISVTIAPVGEHETRLSVVDRGTGISRETAELAVIPFRQVDGRLARKQGGTGLGLSIVNGLIDEHGGRLTIDSEPGKGTVVSLDFPGFMAEAGSPGEAARAAELAAD
jgi:two-component system cell cycle sensor histidine kinase PleC